MISKIEMALLNATNFSKEDIIRLISLLPESQTEGAIEIACGIFVAPEVGATKIMGDKFPYEVKIEKIMSVEKKVYVKGMRPDTKSARIPFKKDTQEYQDLKEKVKEMSSNEAYNFLNAFSGTEWAEFETAEKREFTDWISFQSWESLKDA